MRAASRFWSCLAAARLRGTALALLLAVAGCSDPEPGSVLVLVREGDAAARATADAYLARLGSRAAAAPEDSEAARDADFDQIAVLALPERLGHQIEPADYRTFIEAPLEKMLEEVDPDSRITTLVTTPGIPVQVGSCDAPFSFGTAPSGRPPFEPHASRGASERPRLCRAASVDALLAVLGRLPGPEQAPASDSAPNPPPGPAPRGPRAALAQTPNPYFGEPRSFLDFRAAHPDSVLRFLVARLTGPAAPTDEPGEVPSRLRPLLEPAPEAAPGQTYHWTLLAPSTPAHRTAATQALLAPLEQRLAALPQHALCDDCREQHDGQRDEGQRVAGVVLSKNRSPRIALDQAGLRFGWPGVAIDLVGVGAALRPRADAALGPLGDALAPWLEAGARIVSTHLADPSLAGVTRPDLFLEGLALGQTTGEAHFRSLPHLGWLNVLVGDPLARLPDSGAWTTDRDRDGIPDAEDNCLLEPNAPQRDTDQDGYGNRCDPDVNNDGQVLTSWGQIYPRGDRGDLEELVLTARSGPHDPNHDLDGDGVVDDRDLALAQLWLFRGPGPSGLKP